MTETIRYFAYGSNIVQRQMTHRCPLARPLAPARLDGWRFAIMHRGFATIVPAPTAHVLGLLWSLSPACEAALDRYEGVARGLYEKHELMIEAAPTLVYIASDAQPGAPKPGYLEAIIAAATERQFPAAYIAGCLQPWLADAGKPARPA